MRKKKTAAVRDNRFPPSLFAVYFLALMLLSGIHTGFVVVINTVEMPSFLAVNIPIVYWGLIAAGLTIYTRSQIRANYEEPMHRLAEAARKVAEGDFSVYIPPTNTSDKLDYLDIMLEDFNKMVGELGSIETLKTDFFSNVSHEIKTPLAVIQNNAELLCREDMSEKQAGYAEAIYRASKRLTELITNLLKLNKLEKQTILPETQEYDVCAQLAECALLYEQEWERKRVEFEADLEDRAMITADAALMEMVWSNLLSNAIKFTEPGGCVFLTERSDEKEIRISVKDSGCGMTEETKKHIFEKFYQGDTSHATAGNGLGLALTRRILQLNGFEIEVFSEPGRGSTFTVIIPKTGKEMAAADE